MPFTVNQSLNVLVACNAAIWPGQIGACTFAFVILAALLSQGSGAVRAAKAGLAMLWAFTGILHHLIYFAVINPAAPVFAGFFVLEAAVVAVSAPLQSADRGVVGDAGSRAPEKRMGGGGGHRRCHMRASDERTLQATSIRVGQGSYGVHFRPTLRRALASRIIFRMRAAMAFLGGLPIATRCSYFALRSGLKRMATSVGM